MPRIQFNKISDRIKCLSEELDYQNSQSYQDVTIVSKIDLELDEILRQLEQAKKLAIIEDSGLELIHS